MADEEFMFGDLFATVRVQDLPASREVVAVERQENGTWRVCGSAIANADGIAELGIEGSKTSRVYAFAIDHWGEPFTPNRTVANGDIIRPSVFLGWLYRVTAPGTLPDEEPVWWNSTPGMPRSVGTAMAQAEMYFQPIAHGPVDIEWEDKEEGDPHWDNVVALLHFDGDLVDETGRHWSVLRNAPATFESVDPIMAPASFISGSTVIQSALGGAQFGSGDFTVEVSFTISQFKPENNPGGIVAVRDSNTRISWQINTESDGRVRFAMSTSGTPGSGWVTVYSVTPVALNQVCRFAVVRRGADLYLFFNGNLEGHVVVGAVSLYGGSEYVICGATDREDSTSNRYRHIGLIDELRITKGVARYTKNFTPPTKPFPNFK